MTPRALASIRSLRLFMTLAIATAAVLAVAAPTRAGELGQQCTNPEVGYTVSFPSGWYVNEHVDGGESEDVAPCRFLSPREFEVLAASQASGIAIAIGVQQDGPQEAGEPTTVDGRPATRGESMSEAGGVDPAGTRYYSYWIELTDGTWLAATTSDGPNWVGDYEENTAALDAMLDSLRFSAVTMPDAAIGAGTTFPAGLLTGAGILLVALTLTAMQLRTARLGA
jgi:hypothetical protein